MIPNWKYWTFLILIAFAVELYHVLHNEGLWRYAPLFILGVIYGLFFAKYRKRITEVPNEHA